MSTVTEIVTEVALLVEREPRNDFVFFMLDDALLGDRVVVTPFANVLDAALLNDNYVESAYASFREVALLHDTTTRSVRASVNTRDVALLNDTPVGGVVVPFTVREVALGNDNATYSINVVLSDAAVLNDTTSPKAYLRSNIRESAAFLSRVAAPAGATSRDIALLADTAYSSAVAQTTVRVTALLLDAASSAASQGAQIRDTALLNDNVSARLSTSAALYDVAYLTDTPVPPSYGRAYTCSVVTWGMSTFSNFPFQTMAGKFASTNNLWRIDVGYDNGAEIASHILTGTADMGASQDKRLSAIYVSGTSDSALTVSVIADVDGAAQTYSYALPANGDDSPRNKRVLVGKGFRSRYVQVKISGVGAKYKLLSAEADVAVTARRV